MNLAFNFGRLNQPPALPVKSETFRIAVLGDFSGRANRGELQTGRELAQRKPLRVDVDNLDQILARLGVRLHLPIGAAGGTVEVVIDCMDDWHPDELFEKVELFSELAGLRQRLKSSSTFAAAAAEVKSWLGEDFSSTDSHSRRSRGAAMPTGKISDFARLVGQPAAEGQQSTPADELIRQVVGPYVVEQPDADQQQLIAAVDEALSQTMRLVLHDPDFQSLESLWRSVEMIVRRLETDASLQVVLYDITAEEIAADLSSTQALHETGLYDLLINQPTLDAQQGAISVIVASYQFALIPPHAELLGRVAKIAAAARAPFISSISKECIDVKKPEEIHPLIVESWQQLRSLPESVYLALTTPRFMLRWPYGKKTDPIDPFDFEEFTPKTGLNGMLWGNSATLVGLLLGQTASQQSVNQMKLGSILTVDDLPYYYYTDHHGDQIALPCADRLLNERMASHVLAQNFIPVLAIKGQPQVRLGGFRSLAGAELAGPWAPVSIVPSDEPLAADAGDDTQSTAAAMTSIDGHDEDLADEVESADAPAPAASAEVDSGELDSGEDEPSSGDAELDALLAGLEEEAVADDSDNDDDGMDPELAALLADL